MHEATTAHSMFNVLTNRSEGKVKRMSATEAEKCVYTVRNRKGKKVLVTTDRNEMITKVQKLVRRGKMDYRREAEHDNPYSDDFVKYFDVNKITSGTVDIKERLKACKKKTTGAPASSQHTIVHDAQPGAPERNVTTDTPSMSSDELSIKQIEDEQAHIAPSPFIRIASSMLPPVDIAGAYSRTAAENAADAGLAVTDDAGEVNDDDVDTDEISDADDNTDIIEDSDALSEADSNDNIDDDEDAEENTENTDTVAETETDDTVNTDDNEDKSTSDIELQIEAEDDDDNDDDADTGKIRASNAVIDTNDNNINDILEDTSVLDDVDSKDNIDAINDSENVEDKENTDTVTEAKSEEFTENGNDTDENMFQIHNMSTDDALTGEQMNTDDNLDSETLDVLGKKKENSNDNDDETADDIATTSYDDDDDYDEEEHINKPCELLKIIGACNSLVRLAINDKHDTEAPDNTKLPMTNDDNSYNELRALGEDEGNIINLDEVNTSTYSHNKVTGAPLEMKERTDDENTMKEMKQSDNIAMPHFDVIKFGIKRAVSNSHTSEEESSKHEEKTALPITSSENDEEEQNLTKQHNNDADNTPETPQNAFSDTVSENYNLPMLYDKNGAQIALGDKIMRNEDNNQIGEVIGIGKQCFFVITNKGQITRWNIDNGEYAHKKDTLEDILNDISSDENIDSLVNRFRTIIQEKRNK